MENSIERKGASASDEGVSDRVNKSNVFPTHNLEIRIFKGMDIPEELFLLRKRVYGEECNFLNDEQMFGENDSRGEHICIFDKQTQKLMAATQLVNGEDSDFSLHTGIPRERLKHTFYSSRSMVDPEFRGKDLFTLLLYLAFRQKRMEGRTVLTGFVEAGEIPARKVLPYRFIEGVPPREVIGKDGRKYQVFAVEDDIDFGCYKTFNSMSKDLQEWVGENLMAAEVEELVRRKAKHFYSNPYFQLVKDGRLGKQQYIRSLTDKYQFVRWTTRILGQLVNLSENKDLRRHYLAHLSGEVDHEVLIENDLTALGVDCAYVKDGMVPSVQILEFMAMQESMCAFRRNPVLFLAVPFSIEALSGFMSPQFIESLKSCISSWGVKHPAQACTFLTSHIHYDGGEEGHWEGSKKVLGKFLRSETDLQWMRNIVTLVMDSLDKAYASYGALPDLSQSLLRQSKKTNLNENERLQEKSNN